MSTRFISIDRETPMLLPPDLRDWVPEQHLVHFVVAVRYICGGNKHPDHDTICTFRRENGKATEADRQDRKSVVDIPDEIARREQRRTKLVEARKVIEARFEDKRKEEQADYEAKLAQREAAREAGKKTRGPEPKPPASKPGDKAQYNFTDPAVRQVTKALADTGFYNEEAINKVTQTTEATCYVAVNKQSHHRSLETVLNPQAEPPALPADASPSAVMGRRLATPAGKAIYGMRKQTVEPVFGIIKEAMGFRRFLLRGIGKVSLEWTLVTLAYNIKRLFRLRNPTRKVQNHGPQDVTFAVYA